MKVKFDEIKSNVSTNPGIYEIYTNDGMALKVGIAANLKKRLLQHANSRQKSLKFSIEAENVMPSDVDSKQSILAKHLYFDSSISPKYNLTSEIGRQSFLNEW